MRIKLGMPAWLYDTANDGGSGVGNGGGANDGGAANNGGANDGGAGNKTGANDGGAGNKTGANDGGAGGDNKAGAVDWTAMRATITDPKMKEFAEKIPGPIDAVKIAYDLRVKMGSAIQLPGKDAKPEEINAVFEKLGMPKTADEYKLDPPEDLPEPLKPDDAGKERLAKSRKRLHELRLTSDQAKGVVDMYWADIKDMWAAQDAAQKAATTKMLGDLAVEYGGPQQLKENGEFAMRAAQKYGGDAFMQWAENAVVDGVKLGNHPMFIRAFAAAGRARGEDDYVSGVDSNQRKTLEQRKDELTRHPNRWTDKNIDKELEDINRQLFGTGDQVGFGAGAGGR